jgi:hypothetical protein
MYAQTDTRTYANINGFISLHEGSPQYQPAALPVSYLPNNTVAPFFDDLYMFGQPTPQQGIFYQFNAANTSVTYEYYVSRALKATEKFHFTVQYDSALPGVFVFTYLETGGATDHGSTCAVGVQGCKCLVSCG